MFKRIFSSLIACCLLLTLLGALSGCRSDSAKKTAAKATLNAVGDIYFTDAQFQAATVNGTTDFSATIADVVPSLPTADLTVGNFEGNFFGDPYSAATASYPDAFATLLANAGFDILQTANSYTIYNGIKGMARTKQIIEDTGMSALGSFTSNADRKSNQVVVREVNGIRFAFVGFTKGVSGMTIPDDASYCVNLLYEDYSSNYSKVNTAYILEVLDAAKATAPDVIIACLHWGSENVSEPSDSQEEIATLMFKNGVDVILGSHSHVVSPVERRTVTLDNGSKKDVVIAYNLGDLTAADEGEVNLAPILNLEFTRDGDLGQTSVTNITYRAVVSADLGEEVTPRFQVLDAENALTLYESNYYVRIPDAVYERLKNKLDSLGEALFPDGEPETAE